MFKEIVFLIIFLITLLVLALPLGGYIAKIFTGQVTFLSGILSPLEKLVYKISGINENTEMTWKTYTVSFLIFTFYGFICLFLLQGLQQFLPFNPQKFGPVRWDTALNTAVSFVTNTNWQSYSGEEIMSYLTQMLGLTVQNFLSAASGIAVAIAFIRGFIRTNTNTIGNFWVDL